MKLEKIKQLFELNFGGPDQYNSPDERLSDPEYVQTVDLCPSVYGMASIRKLQLLNLCYASLEGSEAYLEIGTYHGKSAIFAMLGNPLQPTYICDNFSEFQDEQTEDTLYANLDKFNLFDKIRFYGADFRNICYKQFLSEPIGLYFYDGAHDFESQYDAIKLVEPFLAPESIVIIDDWNWKLDPDSPVKPGTMKAISESSNNWELLYDLPARYNGDMEMWWNGVAVFGFRKNE